MYPLAIPLSFSILLKQDKADCVTMIDDYNIEVSFFIFKLAIFKAFHDPHTTRPDQDSHGS